MVEFGSDDGKILWKPWQLADVDGALFAPTNNFGELKGTN
jgi:hypothetical protein